MQISLGFAVRLVIMAASLTLLASGLYALVEFPEYWLNLPSILIGTAVGAVSVPRAHWIRAVVGATAVAAILVMVAVVKQTLGLWVKSGTPPEDWSRHAAAVFVAFLYFVPFWVWLARGKQLTEGPD